MYNKKNSGLTVVGIVAGTVAGVAAIAAGAYMIYKRYIAKKALLCDECELRNECGCHGKCFEECCNCSDCFAEDVEQFSIDDFESTNENF